MNAAVANAITPVAQPSRLRSPSPLNVVLEGRRVGPYLLGERLGRGGMGVVHAARDRDGRAVAVKLLHPHLSDDPDLTRMFYDEARVACRVEHRNVCRVHDYGRQGELLYLAMERLHGTTLSELLADNGALPIWMAARVIRDTARGLHAAHELRDDHGHSLGLVHRDVSPQNVVVLLDGSSKVVDFGVARTRGRIASTSQGVLKGKLAYMSPEQLEELPLDRRADVWALGVLLWEAIAGARLFQRGSHHDVVTAVLTADVPPVRTQRPDCPAELAAIVHRALQEEPMCRYASAAALADALDAFLLGTAARKDDVSASEWVCQFAEAPTMEEADALLDDGDDDDEASTLVSAPSFEARRLTVAMATVLGLSATLLVLVTWLLMLWRQG